MRLVKNNPRYPGHAVFNCPHCMVDSIPYCDIDEEIERLEKLRDKLEKPETVMKHQTNELIEAAKDAICDFGVFNEEQINALTEIIERIAEATINSSEKIDL